MEGGGKKLQVKADSFDKYEFFFTEFVKNTNERIAKMEEDHKALSDAFLVFRTEERTKARTIAVVISSIISLVVAIATVLAVK